MPRGPRKRRRPAARPAAPKAATSPVAPVAREWCETHRLAYVAGDAAHEGCIHFALATTERHTDAAVDAVYLDEAQGRALERVSTRMEGTDRVLGGGLVMGSVVLISGEKGTGKSTWLLQVVDAFLRQNRPVLYVSGEESNAQVADRARRLKVATTGYGKVLSTGNLEDFHRVMGRLRGTADDPDLIIADSAQTIVDLVNAVGSKGSPTQALAVAQALTDIAKKEHRIVILVGQENKAGEAAGLQQMPHLVDVVLELRKDGRARRYLINTKNRFGQDYELAVFDMTPTGLREIGNVTEEHLEHRLGDVGIVAFAAAHNARPILLAVEASALRKEEDIAARGVDADGYNMKRLRNVLDRLQADCGCYILDRAIRVHVPKVLGEEIDDEEIDLAVAAALLSALHDRPPPKALVFGSVGIGGHVASEFRAETRLAAARDHKRLRFTDAVIPARAAVPDGMKVQKIGHLRDLEHALWGTRTGMARPPKAEKGDPLAA